jgi:histidine ammonia-lyase
MLYGLPRSRPWAERARQASVEAGNAGEVATDAEIVRALRRKAARGDVSAARELREWLQVESAQTDTNAWMRVLDARERRWVGDH